MSALSHCHRADRERSQRVDHRSILLRRDRSQIEEDAIALDPRNDRGSPRSQGLRQRIGGKIRVLQGERAELG